MIGVTQLGESQLLVTLLYQTSHMLYSCPNNSIECIDQNQREYVGWVLLVIIILIFTLSDIIDGFRVYYYNSMSRNIKGTLTDLILLSFSFITLVASPICMHSYDWSIACLLKDSVAYRKTGEWHVQRHRNI